MIQPVVDPAWIVLGSGLLITAVAVGALTSAPRHRWPWWRRGLMVLLLAAIALRPTPGEVRVDSTTPDFELLVVVDSTASMSAGDWHDHQRRLDGAVSDIEHLSRISGSARFSILSFGSDVREAIPSTRDTTLIREAAAGIRTESADASAGSSLSRPIREVRRWLSRVESNFPDRARIVVLMSDGEQTAGSGEAADFASLASRTDGGAVLGYGTATGATMPRDPDLPAAGLVPDPETGAPAVSKLDETNLRLVAAELGVPYQHRTTPGGLRDLVAAWERVALERAAPDGDSPSGRELYWLLALALLGLALVDLRSHWRGFLLAARELS